MIAHDMAATGAVVSVELADAAVRLVGENRSKLLRSGSTLYDFIMAAQAALSHTHIAMSTPRPPHIEIAREPPSDAARTARAQELHGRTVPLAFTRMHDAIVVPTGPVAGYGETHATVVHVRDMSVEDARFILRTLEDLVHTVAAHA